VEKKTKREVGTQIDSRDETVYLKKIIDEQYD
jgi:hypothetical protein